MQHYSDLLNVEELGSRREGFEQQRGSLAYYCKECNTLVDIEHIEEATECAECGSLEIALGTHEGLKQNYKRKK